MVLIKDIDAVLSRIAPAELSESWDNDGIMLCKSKNLSVKKILIMLEVSKKGVMYAIEHGFNLIVTHHPFIFKPLSRITDETYELIELLIRNDISVMSYHTRMDSCDEGVNSVNAELLGLSNVRGFGGESQCIGKIGELENAVTAEVFGTFIKEKFGCGTVRASLFENPDKKIKTVAVVGGAGKSFFYDAYKAGADAYVTSEVAHNTFIDCKELDMCIFDCGHYFTENAVCGRFKDIIESSFKDSVCVEVYDVGSPYINL